MRNPRACEVVRSAWAAAGLERSLCYTRALPERTGLSGCARRTAVRQSTPPGATFVVNPTLSIQVVNQLGAA